MELTFVPGEHRRPACGIRRPAEFLPAKQGQTFSVLGGLRPLSTPKPVETGASISHFESDRAFVRNEPADDRIPADVQVRRSLQLKTLGEQRPANFHCAIRAGNRQFGQWLRIVRLDRVSARRAFESADIACGRANAPVPVRGFIQEILAPRQSENRRIGSCDARAVRREPKIGGGRR